jgi:predicted alpha/beta-fold hydrolase
MLPPGFYQAPRWLHGGHAGFAGGAFPCNLEWLPRRLLAFFSEYV